MPASKTAYSITRADKASIRFSDGLARVDAVVAPGIGLPQDGAIGRGFSQSIEHWPAYPDSVAVSALSRDGDGLHDIHHIGVARQLGHTGGTLESEHTMPDYRLATVAELADAVHAGITEMKRSV